MFDPMARVGAQLVEEALLRRLMSEQEARERALHLLEQLGLREPAATMSAYPHQLSGGMIQRVAIAMALMTRPAVLFVDEPTSALDAHVRHEVLGLIRRLAAEEGTATFLISHDLFSVSRYCDAIVVMYGGRIVETGPTATVLERPQHPYTAALLRCSPTTRGAQRERLPVISGAPPAPGQWPSGCVFHPRCPLRFERCPVERPALRTEGEHAAACHLAFGPGLR
jgi:oligopeptide/dipeptide ABC transporter ATP-binding protein